MVSMNDWRGTPFEVGCTVVYPQASGSHLGVLEAIVLEITEQPKNSWQPDGDKIPVLVVQRTKETSYGPTPRLPYTNKSSRLTAIQRVTVVPSAES